MRSFPPIEGEFDSSNRETFPEGFGGGFGGCSFGESDKSTVGGFDDVDVGDLSIAVEVVSDVGFVDGGTDVTNPEGFDEFVRGGDHVSGFLLSSEHFFGDGVVGAIVTIFEVLFGQVGVVFIFGVDVAVGASGATVTFTTDEERTNVGFVTFVVWSTTGETGKLKILFLFFRSKLARGFQSSLGLVGIILTVDVRDRNHALAGFGGITDLNREAVFEVEQTDLTNVFQLGTRLTDFGFFVTRTWSWFPTEDSEGASTDLTFFVELGFGHPDVWVLTKTSFTRDGELGFLPPFLIDVIFN